MKKYHVLVQETHVSTVEVEADNEWQAMLKVQEGEGEEITCEYSSTNDMDEWTVEEVE